MPDYAFYTNIYYGNQIFETDFPRLITRASTYISRLNCTTTDETAKKMAACAVAEAWQTNDQGGDIVSQTVGSWSKAFATKKTISDDQRLLAAAQLYLGSCARWV